MPTATRSRLVAPSTAVVQDARAVRQLSTDTRINRVPISPFGAVARVTGPVGISAPLSSITWTLSNASGGPLTYVIGDPTLLVAGAHGGTWTQPTAVNNGSVAGVQSSFSSLPVTVAGLNYTVTSATQYGQSLMYRYADRDGRYGGQPIDIEAILRNSQYISTRQTLMFESEYLLDDLHCFTLTVLDGEVVTLSLLLGANNA